MQDRDAVAAHAAVNKAPDSSKSRKRRGTQRPEWRRLPTAGRAAAANSRQQTDIRRMQHTVRNNTGAEARQNNKKEQLKN